MTPASPLTRSALDPRTSVVVEACAGSGKTWLLVSRIVRLLLDGADPAEILAITFTRKAAQEMRTRLNDWLRRLATEDEAAVRDRLLAWGLAEDELAQRLPQARGLFERVLYADPGITIDTFHGWFLKLLSHAPLGAAAGEVTLLEHTASLREEAWQAFADRLAGAKEEKGAQALVTLFREWGLANTRQALEDFLNRRTEWLAFTGGGEDAVERAMEALHRALGSPPEEDPLAAFFRGGAEEEIAFLADILSRGGKRAQGFALRLARDEQDDESRFSALQSVVFTSEGRPRKEVFDLVAREAGEAGTARLEYLSKRILDTAEARLARRILHLNEAAFRCATAYLAQYQRLKEARGALDFADIELFAWRLVTTSDHAEYLQYKLDARFRHVLIDEFQDTNPVQWQILRAWLAASEAADRRPTVFLVGDPKQSIYRFRGAEPRLFTLARDWLKLHYGAIHLTQDESRRCAPAVIDVVNRVFGALPDFPHFRPHRAHRQSLPGGVLILPLAVAEEPQAAEQRLRNPLVEPLPEPVVGPALEAQALAACLRELVGRLPVWTETGQRPARFGDIMVLTRSRNHLSHFEEAFKAAGIPFLSARRGGLLETLEVSDLRALLEFLVLPFADLRLAQVLKSPLFGATDEDLLCLAGRAERTWWQRLQALVQEGLASTPLCRAAQLLSAWRDLTDHLPVHDLLDRIYAEGEVIERYLRAVPPPLHAGVVANLHAFLELALKVQGGRYPSLPRFLQELADLSRAGEEAPDEGAVAVDDDAVRIHTIHGAKGLEAPIVCLIDAQHRGNHNDAYRVLVQWPPEADTPTHFSFQTRKDQVGRARAALVEEQTALARREELNLLYVALTRARQYLIVSASGRAEEADSFYGRIRAAAPAHPLDLATLPRPAPVVEPRPPAVAALVPPSATPVGRRILEADTPAIRRGIALHRLLEVLGRGTDGLNEFALRRELKLDAQTFVALAEEARHLITQPALARFFDPRQFLRAENELAFVNQDGEIGRIDRLVEFREEVWILDYKMGEAASPSRIAAYRSQLATYRQAMAPLFPGKAVRTAVIFADGTLMELSP